ncbi:MAG: site-specific DNA-methyltransferase [Candidatus Nitrosopolaris sp.]
MCFTRNEHFAIFPEDLIARIINFSTKKEDWVLDPFVGRGTTGIVCTYMKRNFCGIDLYSENVSKAQENIRSASKGKIPLKINNHIESVSDVTPLEAYIDTQQS